MDRWDVDIGVAFIPWDRLPPGLDNITEGSTVDEDSLPPDFARGSCHVCISNLGYYTSCPSICLSYLGY